MGKQSNEIVGGDGNVFISAQANRPADAPHHPAGTLLELSLADINLVDRSRVDLGDVEEMVESVKKFGQLQPVIVAAEPNQPGKYRMLDGGRRYEAFKSLGIPAIVVWVKAFDVDAAPVVESEANRQRKDFNPLERLSNYRKILSMAAKAGERRGRPSDENKMCPNSDTFLPGIRDGEKTRDYAIRMAGISGLSVFTELETIDACPTAAVREAVVKDAISVHRGYLIAQSKPTEHLKLLRMATSDDDTDKAALRKIFAKQAEGKALKRAGINLDSVAKADDVDDEDGKDFDDDAYAAKVLGFGVDAKYLLIRIAPDFFAHKVATLSKFPIDNLKQPEALVCIEVDGRRVNQAFDLVAAWKLHFHSMITVHNPKNTIPAPMFLRDHPFYIIVCGFVQNNRTFDKVKAPSAVGVPGNPRDDALTVIEKYFLPLAIDAALDASSKTPRARWLNCFLNHNYMVN